MIQIDMPMPACCNDCFALDDHGDYPFCLISHDQRGYNFKVYEQRMPSCPLKTQQPRVMTLEEAKDALKRDPVIWFEESIQCGGRIIAGLRIYETDKFTMQTDEVLSVNEFDDEIACKYYGKKYRLWTSRPTPEQREAEPWEN